VKRTTTIELEKEDMKFSAGHFTIFSADHRERLHGHNFNVSVALTSFVGDDGLVADYGIYKRKLAELCKEWNEYFLLPAHSPHLQLREEGPHLFARFAGVDIPFLKTDVLVLPVTNVTLEELSSAFLAKVIAFRTVSGHDQVLEVVVKVFSGPGQSASARWALHPQG
jgi:6-pyruvoyltetrahydropterin/6-carboxytetrahydropterin synthase